MLNASYLTLLKVLMSLATPPELFPVAAMRARAMIADRLRHRGRITDE
jgi:hypothetical protein